MKKLRAWFETPGGRQFFNIIYSLGAAVVIIGALFKIIHVRGGDTIFIIGMSIEAFIFFLSAFDTSYTDSSPATGAGGGYIVSSGDAIQSTSGSSISGRSDSTKGAQSGSVGGGSSVIVVGGGGYSGPATVGGGTANVGSVAASSTLVGASSNIPTDEYAQSVTSAAQNLEDFSQTMKSLNETSQTILQAYKEIAETQNLGETMNTLRYINDSLGRIKNLYDGAIGDSYMFKEEMSKMTRHIESLNQVYARLLQAMTMNNPNNNNNFPNNPPY